MKTDSKRIAPRPLQQAPAPQHSNWKPISVAPAPHSSTAAINPIFMNSTVPTIANNQSANLIPHTSPKVTNNNNTNNSQNIDKSNSNNQSLNVISVIPNTTTTKRKNSKSDTSNTATANSNSSTNTTPQKPTSNTAGQVPVKRPFNNLRAGKPIPAWLQAASSRDPLTNFTIPKATPPNSTAANQISRNNSSINFKSGNEIRVNGRDFYSTHLGRTDTDTYTPKKPILKVHVFATHLKFEGQPGTSSLDGPLKNFVECLDSRELPATLLDVFDKSNFLYIKGCLVVDLLDYRSSPKNDRAVNSRIFLRPTSKSVWADVCRLQSQTGQPFNEQKALEIESQLLLTLEPELDLSPNPTVSTISNILHYRETIQQDKNNKRPHSIAHSETQKSDQQEFSKLMRIMDDDRYNTSFSPSFDLIKYLKHYRANQQNEDAIPSMACDSKTTKGYQPLPKGYNIIRSIRFKKEMTQGTIFSLINLYHLPTNRFEICLRYGTQIDTSLNGRTVKIPISNASAALAHLENLKAHYSLSHQLVSDLTSPYYASCIPSARNAQTVPVNNPNPSIQASSHPAFHTNSLGQQGGTPVPQGTQFNPQAQVQVQAQAQALAQLQLQQINQLRQQSLKNQSIPASDSSAGSNPISANSVSTQEPSAPVDTNSQPVVCAAPVPVPAPAVATSTASVPATAVPALNATIVPQATSQPQGPVRNIFPRITQQQFLSLPLDKQQALMQYLAANQANLQLSQNMMTNSNPGQAPNNANANQTVQATPTPQQNPQLPSTPVNNTSSTPNPQIPQSPANPAMPAGAQAHVRPQTNPNLAPRPVANNSAEALRAEQLYRQNLIQQQGINALQAHLMQIRPRPNPQMNQGMTPEILAQYRLMQQYQQMQARMRNWPGANAAPGTPGSYTSMPNQTPVLPAQSNAINPQNTNTNTMPQDVSNVNNPNMVNNRPRPIPQNIASAQHPRPIMPRPTAQYHPIAMAPPHPAIRPINGIYRPLSIRPTPNNNPLPSSPHPPPSNS